MVVKLYIGNDRLDLFKDENIVVTSTITDTQDISKNVGDYSKTFTVPATETNNLIFKHYYDADVDNTFDARIKVSGRIELDGLPFKVGKWRLSKVKVKKGFPSSYTINFFGRLVSLKTLFKKDELSSLDLSAYDHDHTPANVKLGLTDELFSGVIKYPLITRKQYYYNDDPSSVINTETLSNIAYNGADVGIDYNDLQPSIKLIAIIEAIETKYDLTFSRDFFGRVEFDELYLHLLNNTDRPLGGDSQIIDWDGGDNTYTNLTDNISYLPVQNTSASSDRIYFKLKCTITPDSGYEDVPYTVRVYLDGEEYQTRDYTGTRTKTTTIRHEGELVTKEVYYEVVTTQEFKYTASLKQTRYSSVVGGTVIAFVTTTASSNTIDSVVTIVEEIPKIKVIDFLKGLFSMFKLVVIPTTDTDIYVNTLNSYYALGGLYDVTPYVDFESYDVKRGNIYNEINFNFEEPETILQIQFDKNTGLFFGDEELQLADEDGEPLDGDKLEIKIPFEQLIYERLPNLNDNEITNLMYGAVIDEEAEASTMKPHIHYIINQPVGGYTAGFITTSTIEELSTNINIPSHTLDLDTLTNSTLWSAEYSEWDGSTINGTLYKNYYEDFILSVFNIKRREWIFKCVLPLNILAALDLNDTIQIKERYYRIQKFDLNLTTGESTLNLINNFDDRINPFSASETIYFIDSNARTMSSYINALEVITAQKIDVGDGVDWVTATVEGNNVIIDVDENLFPADRNVNLFITNESKTKDLTIYITQTEAEASMNFESALNSQYIPILTLKV